MAFPLHDLSAQKVSAKNINALSEFPLSLRKKIREVEKYQWNIAEKYYIKGDYKVAAGEYEKYLKLYERSLAAPYAQLKWSNCQVRLKKLNTAIKDGYQSVIDYWPESPAAISARFLIGRTHKQMGEMKAAKRVLNEVVKKHPKHDVAVYALVEMIDIAGVEKDATGRVTLWKQLTYDIPRDKGKAARRSSRNGLCAAAAVNLAKHHFSEGAFDDGVKAIETTYPEIANARQRYDRVDYVVYSVRPAIGSFMRDTKTKAQGKKLADRAISYVEKQIPTDLSDAAANTRARQYLDYVVSLHSDVGRDAEALKTYQKMLTLFKNADSILGNMASWLEQRRRYEEARKAYGQYADKLAGANRVAQSYLNQASSYWSSGKRSLAVTFSQRAADAYGQVPAKEKPDVIKSKANRASAFRSASYYSRRSGKAVPAKNFDNEAIAIYQQLIKDDPGKSQSWRMEIARTYRNAGDYKNAIANYRQCGDVFPTSQIEMAGCHRALKQWRQAVSSYRVAAASKSYAPEAHYQIALTYRQAKNKASEIAALRLVCKRFPRHRRASEAHTWLQQTYKINVTLGGKKDE